MCTLSMRKLPSPITVAVSGSVPPAMTTFSRMQLSLPMMTAERVPGTWWKSCGSAPITACWYTLLPLPIVVFSMMEA